MLEQWLRLIRAMWPQCPAGVSSDGRDLIIDHAPRCSARCQAGGRANCIIFSGRREARAYNTEPGVGH
jgi:hypothetical protein